MEGGGWGLGEGSSQLLTPNPESQRMAPAEIAQQTYRKGRIVQCCRPGIVVRHAGRAGEQVLEATLSVARRFGHGDRGGHARVVEVGLKRGNPFIAVGE